MYKLNVLRLFLVNGGLSKWSEFSQCSRTCGGGVSKRHRQCNNPEPLHGGRKCDQSDMQETRSCGNIKCINILKGKCTLKNTLIQYSLHQRWALHIRPLREVSTKYQKSVQLQACQLSAGPFLLVCFVLESTGTSWSYRSSS